MRELPATESVRASPVPVAPVRYKSELLPGSRQIHRPGNVWMVFECEDRVVVASLQLAHTLPDVERTGAPSRQCVIAPRRPFDQADPRPFSQRLGTLSDPIP